MAPHWKVIDVGGQRSERRKWLPYMDAVQGVLFFINSHGYRVVLYEDSATLRVHEDMSLFERTMKDNFQKVPLTLVFTKEDLYHANFDEVRFKAAFPELKEDEKKWTSQDGVMHLETVFNKLTPVDRQYPLKIVWLCTFDNDAVRQVFYDMQQKILHNNRVKILKLCDLLEEIPDAGKSGKSKKK